MLPERTSREACRPNVRSAARAIRTHALQSTSTSARSMGRTARTWAPQARRPSAHPAAALTKVSVHAPFSIIRS